MNPRTDGLRRAASVLGGPVRTVFLGSGRFAVETLWRLDTHPDLELIGVVTAPHRPAGRKQRLTCTDVESAALELGIRTILRPERLRAPDSVAAVMALQPALVVLADYGQIVPAALLDVPHAALNLHPSLLPRHRGASPISAAILAGDAETGVTLMRMDAGLDTGPIVAQVAIALTGTERAPDLEDRLMLVAADLLEDRVRPWIRGELEAVPQPADGATLTRPLRREDARLDASRHATELERQVRAYLPWPGSFLELDGERLAVTDATVAPSEPGDVAGSLVRAGDVPALATIDGRLILESVTPAGRKPMPGADWLRGRRSG